MAYFVVPHLWRSIAVQQQYCIGICVYFLLCAQLSDILVHSCTQLEGLFKSE